MNRRKFISRTVLVALPVAAGFGSTESDNGENTDNEQGDQNETVELGGQAIEDVEHVPSEEASGDGTDITEAPGMIYANCEYPEDSPCDERDE